MPVAVHDLRRYRKTSRKHPRAAHTLFLNRVCSVSYTRTCSSILNPMKLTSADCGRPTGPAWCRSVASSTQYTPPMNKASPAKPRRNPSAARFEVDGRAQSKHRQRHRTHRRANRRACACDGPHFSLLAFAFERSAGICQKCGQRMKVTMNTMLLNMKATVRLTPLLASLLVSLAFAWPGHSGWLWGIAMLWRNWTMSSPLSPPKRGSGMSGWS